jgi:WXG100 family type VII secretion target
MGYTPNNNNTATPDDYTYANFPSMEKAYEDLKKIVTELDTATDDLYNDIKAVLGVHWEGAAREYFEGKKAEWNALEKQMGEQLFNAANAVSIAKGNYETAERRNISIWSD